MILVEILAIIVLFLSFLGGWKEGAVRKSFALVVTIIALPLAGLGYHLLANLLGFLPGENWENAIGFFLALGLISALLHLIFLLPRKIIQAIWKKGAFYRLFGGALSVLNAGIGFVVFTLVVAAYPFSDWLEKVLLNSSVLSWLVTWLSFVQALLPEVFRDIATSIVTALTI